ALQRTPRHTTSRPPSTPSYAAAALLASLPQRYHPASRENQRMNRRAFVTGLGAVLAVPRAAVAQHTGKVARVAFLETASLAANAPHRTRFQEQLRELGHIEGRTIAFEARAADGRNERLLGLADELVRLNVDVIVVAGTAAAIAAKRVTSVVPIVMAIVSDPVNLGLVGSPARPGGTVTGVADLYVELTGKRLELLKEILPRLARVALISKTDHPKPQEALREAEGAARALGVQLQSVGVRDPREFGGAFSKIVQDHADAVIFEADALFISQRSRLVDL